MPELPDITIYVESLERYLADRVLERIRIAGPFVLQTVSPPPEAFSGRRVIGFRRLGKRIVWAFEEELFLVFHLMVAGRLHWTPPGTPIPKRMGLAAFDFGIGTVLFMEAGTKRRATLHAVFGPEKLLAFRPGGVEPLESDLATFRAALAAENHTLKRALTDPRLVSGVGNAYSDEILHRARLSPLALTSRLDEDAWRRLWEAARAVLGEWTARLRAETGRGFPAKVTASRPGMAVHGRFGEPCPDCGAPVQRIVYAENETNYCPACQTGGRILADRALSRLLKADWPRSIEDLEERGAEV